jgi:hypothetical protein
MVRIQLENGFLDIKEGSNFPLNFGVADVRDVSARSGATSKTLTATGSKNNNDLLNHYYDVNIVAGTFDINALTKCTVLQNGIPVMEDCYLQLLSVNKVQKSSNYEQEVEYELMVKDAQADFFTLLNNKELTDIDFSNLNHVISSSNVVASFSNDVTDGYKYLLPWTSDNVYPLKEMRPAIYAKRYFDAIFATNGFDYTWSTSATAKFEKLVIPYNGDLPLIDYTTYQVLANTTDTLISSNAVGQNNTFVDQLTTWTETTDAEGVFDDTTGEYTSDFYVTSGEAVVFNCTIDLDMNLVNSSGANAYLYSANTAGNNRYYPKIYLYVNGVYYISSVILTLANYTRNVGASPLANGSTNVISGTYNISIPVSGLVPTDVVTIYAGVQVLNGASPLWKDANTAGGTLVQVDTELVINDLAINVQPSTNIIGTGSTIDMNRFIPKKIKQKDFVKGVLTMFNLFIDIDKTAPNTLILQHRDDYYDSGVEVDWTNKLCKDIPQQLMFLPDVTAKKLLLTYKADNDKPNTDYVGVTNEIYGQVEYTFDSEYQRGVDTKEILFSPTPIGKTVFGAYVPFIAGSAPTTNIRILVDGGLDTCSAYNIYDYGTTGQTGLTSYPILGHFDNPLNPTFDLNFATCDYYYYNGVYPTNNNLYNKYWRRTVNQINSGKMLIAHFDLNEVDIQRMRLNDKIRIDNSWWNINKVIDYNANIDSYTKVELISIDTEIDFAPFKTRNPKLPNDSQIGLASVDIIRKVTDNNNVVMNGADVAIKGRGNVVMGGVRGFIEGDDGIIIEDGIYNFVDGVNVYGKNFANADLTFTGNRLHDTDGNGLIISTDGATQAESYIYMDDTSSYFAYGGSYIGFDATSSEIFAAGIASLRFSSTNAIFLRGEIHKYTAVSSTYIILDQDYIVDCTANTFTATLPTAASVAGKTYTVKNSGSGVITLEGNGSETIDGATTRTLIQYESIKVASNGTNWIII